MDVYFLYKNPLSEKTHNKIIQVLIDMNNFKKILEFIDKDKRKEDS
jgi:hypothetical protein